MIGETHITQVFLPLSYISMAEGNALRTPTFYLQLNSNLEKVNQTKNNFCS